MTTCYLGERNFAAWHNRNWDGLKENLGSIWVKRLYIVWLWANSLFSILVLFSVKKKKHCQQTLKDFEMSTLCKQAKII